MCWRIRGEGEFSLLIRREEELVFGQEQVGSVHFVPSNLTPIQNVKTGLCSAAKCYLLELLQFFSVLVTEYLFQCQHIRNSIKWSLDRFNDIAKQEERSSGRLAQYHGLIAGSDVESRVSLKHAFFSAPTTKWCTQAVQTKKIILSTKEIIWMRLYTLSCCIKQFSTENTVGIWMRGLWISVLGGA